MDYDFCLIAHNIRSLGNVGSVFRSADAFGVGKIFLTGYTGIPPRKEITKTALGADTFVSWEQADDPLEVVQDLRARGFMIVSLEQAPGSVPIASFAPVFPLCLILGNELAGVREDLLATSDAIVEIPMHGQKESLNVAVAAGITFYALRNR